MDCVFFDLDDTLYDQVEPFAQAYREVFGERFDLDVEALFRASRHHSDAVFEASERGEIPMSDMYVYRLQRAFEDLGATADAEDCLAMQSAYSYNQEHAITLFPHIDEVLDWCCAHSRAAVITNGPGEHQLAKAKALGLERWIPREAVFVSSIEGVAKPSAAMYRLACERMGTTVERSVFVGDSFGMDVVGGVGAGMPTVWFNHRRRMRPERPAPDWTVESVEELLALLPTLP